MMDLFKNGGPLRGIETAIHNIICFGNTRDETNPHRLTSDAL